MVEGGGGGGGGGEAAEGAEWMKGLKPSYSYTTMRLATFNIVLFFLVVQSSSVEVSGNLLSGHQRASEILLAFKKAVGDPNVLKSWVGEPCSALWRGVNCSGGVQSGEVTSLKLTNLRLSGPIAPELGNLTSLVTLWLDSNQLIGPIPSSLPWLQNLTSLRLSNNCLNGEIPPSLLQLPKLRELYLDYNQLSGTVHFADIPSATIHVVLKGNPRLCSPTSGFNLSSCASSLAPGIVFGPVADVKVVTGKDKAHVGAIAGGVAGATVLVGASIALVTLCLLRAKSLPADESDTGSSEPSAIVDWVKGPDGRLGGVLAALPESQQAGEFTMDELVRATKSFSTNNLIGEGGFGPVYKGLLDDGTIVAIKRRPGSPTSRFAEEAERLARIRHRHLVNVLGFCQDSELQMLLFDYLPNGSTCNHLYDVNGIALGKLDFKERLSIALGAGKGLQYLHARGVVHKDFKTSNVLLDENFVAKVTDFGLARLLGGENPDMVPSSTPNGTNGFLDPGFAFSQTLTVKSDVYSFGVFLLELISGREAISLNRPQSEWNLVRWGRSLLTTGKLGTFVDETLGGNFTEEAMRRVVEIGFNCVELSGEKRPTMADVARDLEAVLEKERGLVATPSEGPTTVTLGSELFA